MSTETILPDVGFSREQKEYLQGYFTGLACSGLIPFVGHLPNGRITNVPAPGLVNSAAEPEASAEETVYGTPVSDLCEQEIWKLEQHGLARKTHQKASKAASFFCKFLVFNKLNFTKRTPLR